VRVRARRFGFQHRDTEEEEKGDEGEW